MSTRGIWKVRRRTTRAVLATVLVGAAGVAIAEPAFATDTESYHNLAGSSSATLRPSSDSGNAHAEVSIGLRNGYWTVQVIGQSPSHHTKVFLKSTSSTGRCLDSHASGSGGDAWVQSCNGGDYQVWEVFHQGASIAFKSWGAFTQQGRHLCLALGDNGHAVMKTCNIAADSTQLWY
jgi:hypothetical protein